MSLEHIALSILIWFALYLIVSLSLNIEYGFGGIPNFGRALAVLVGAIAVGAFVNRVIMLVLGINGDIIYASGEVKSLMNELISKDPLIGVALFLLVILLAAALGALTGALFILPSARLSEDYLAITLLAISEVLFMVSYCNPRIIGGYYGVSVPDIFAWAPGEWREPLFALLLIFTATVIYFITDRILSSPYGRLLKAMREDEEVVRACGRDVMWIRIRTVALGSSIAAVAGALYSLYTLNVIATGFGRVEWTFYPFLMVLLGGAGNKKGVVAGTISFVLIKILLMTYKYEIKDLFNLPFETVWLEYIIFGILMLLILLFRPQGLIEEEPIMTEPMKEAWERYSKEKT
ncbi:MAG TPA: branched-chain amino acid ABC transporter permease [Candidatus Syntrophoarchaeum butanivorans]|uniref:Branched-chain amino acid ABC transporter permease n=1 Tax=Candidatus Syntropharchaeum butanivorans TaxID=1839936 RepID=A0A7J2S2H2_9EURY|nr:branched-chain amino acid ABC transporter permease [Candidatus Syntrophoarchaeum butanivorans]